MKNLNMKPFWYILAAYSVLVLFVAAFLEGSDLRNFLDVLRLIPVVATADGIAYLIFTSWLWRWNRLQGWLIPFPDLNGTWQGCVQTDWKDDEGEIPGPIPAILTIRQSFGRLTCVLRTAEEESHTYLEGLCIDKDAQLRQLCHCYTSRPKAALRYRSTPHDGAAVLNIIGKTARRRVLDTTANNGDRGADLPNEGPSRRTPPRLASASADSRRLAYAASELIRRRRALLRVRPGT